MNPEDYVNEAVFSNSGTYNGVKWNFWMDGNQPKIDLSSNVLQMSDTDLFELGYYVARDVDKPVFVVTKAIRNYLRNNQKDEPKETTPFIPLTPSEKYVDPPEVVKPTEPKNTKMVFEETYPNNFKTGDMFMDDQGYHYKQEANGDIHLLDKLVGFTGEYYDKSNQRYNEQKQRKELYALTRLGWFPLLLQVNKEV